MHMHKTCTQAER